MRALVTGCAGFIGSHLTESLLRDGHEVLGVDCFNNNYGRRQKLRNLEEAQDWDDFEFVPIDLARGALDDLLTEVETVFHLAAEPGVRPSWGSGFESYVRNNVSATQHLLEAIRVRENTTMVYASSSSIYGQAESFPTREDATPMPHSPYGMTKLAGEHLCEVYRKNFGVRCAMLRFFSVYGPRQRPDMAFRIFCEALYNGLPLHVFGDGNQTRDFTYVGDIVMALRAAAITDAAVGRPLNIGGGSRVSLLDTIEILGAVAGRDPEVVHQDQQKGDVRDTAASIDAAREVLGFVPKTELRDGLLAQWEWLCANQDVMTVGRS